MGKVWFVFGVLVMLGAAGVESANAPAPVVDCSTVIVNMLDCISFLTNSTVTKPERACCSGLKTVLKTGPKCLCEALKNSAQYGIALNKTKAVTLPSACGLSASASQCDVSSGAPEAAPAKSPAPSPKSANPPASTPSATAPKSAESPASTPSATAPKSAKSPASTPSATAPKSAKSPASTPSATAPTPSGTDPLPPTSGSITAEAPAPGTSSASSVSIPFMLLLGVIVASYSFF